jgi:phosphoribosyl-AMP cyclohydrolase / phosphoribosyl-ATP pyrophosphohydrolase
MNNTAFNLNNLKYNAEGLIPVIVQDVFSKAVLMLAYMNETALKQTLETKQGTYYSRSRQSIWVKGETSGHTQRVRSIAYDCDQDTLLMMVEQVGAACHTGNQSCFFETLLGEVEKSSPSILDALYDTIVDRKNNPLEGAYTTYLFNKGIDKILKKVGEETAEIIIGAKNNSKSETVYEISDLVYHLLVLMVNQGITLEDIREELTKRRK